MLNEKVFRADAIMRTGVLQPYPNPSNPVDLARDVLARFVAMSQGASPEPDPETIARRVVQIAEWMRNGVSMPPYTSAKYVEAARALNCGTTITICSQGRSVMVDPRGNMVVSPVSNGGSMEIQATCSCNVMKPEAPPPPQASVQQGKTADLTTAVARGVPAMPQNAMSMAMAAGLGEYSRRRR